MTTVADQSDTTLWGWPMWVAVLAAIVATIAIVRVIDRLNTTPNAAPEPDSSIVHAQVPGRARTAAGPALRVHLCTRGCEAPVPNPGGECSPWCESPVHAAERILRGEAS